jgi:crossover junction endodeoxyribonuclease RusA
MAGPLMVNVDIFPPDKRRRDIDNCLKSLLDALQHGGAYLDDNQIVVLHATKHPPSRDGHVIVAIRQVADTPSAAGIAAKDPPGVSP